MNKKVFLIAILLIFAGIGGGYAVFQSSQQATNLEKKQEEELSKYTNTIMRFSLLVPNWTYGYGWTCSNPAQRAGRLPLTTFYDIKQGIVKIAPQYILVDNPQKTDCTKVEFTFDQDHEKAGFPHWWEIRSAPIKDERELVAFIKKTYGAGCGLEKLVTTEQEGVFEAVLKENTLAPTSRGSCLINSNYVIKYSPSEKKLFTWNTGQEDTWTDVKGAGYDQRMLDSFRFERGE